MQHVRSDEVAGGQVCQLEVAEPAHKHVDRPREASPKTGTAFIRSKKMIRSDVHSSRKEQTWEHSMCALEVVEGNENDANASTVSKLTMLPASGFSAEIMMKQSEEFVARLKEVGRAPQRGTRAKRVVKFKTARRARTQTQQWSSRQSRDREQRDACVQTMAMSETGAVRDQNGWCFLLKEPISPVFMELLEDRSSDLSNEEYMLAT